ncbi:hypothetical protein Tco_1140367 [Tanacetum coccineum]
MMYERRPTVYLFKTHHETQPSYILMFQQHQDESRYDAWTRFKNLIQSVPHHGLYLWSLAKFFYDHVDRYTKIEINYAPGGNLRRLSAEEAIGKTIKDYVVRVMIPKCMSWLDAFDEPIEEVEEIIGIPMEVEPLDHTKLEDLGLNTCSHDLFPSSREFPSVDEPEPQPLPNLPFLDVNLGGK